MKVFILAAGLGTRMGDLTREIPKPMLNIAGRPKLAWTLDKLPEEIEEVYFVVGYLKDQIIDYFGDFYNGRKIFYLEQEELNGSAGAIALAKDLISESEKFLVLMGDDLYLKSDLEKMIKEGWALLAYETEDAESFGLVSVDEDGYLENVIERPHNFKEGLVNTGAYLLGKEYFDIEPVKITEKEFGLPQTISRLSREKEIKVKILKTDKWLPIGDIEALKEAQKRINEFDD